MASVSAAGVGPLSATQLGGLAGSASRDSRERAFISGSKLNVGRSLSASKKGADSVRRCRVVAALEQATPVEAPETTYSQAQTKEVNYTGVPCCFLLVYV